jgi:F-type H+-transporting ATPase subunit a
VNAALTLAASDSPLGHVLDKPLIPGMPAPWGPLLTMNTLTMLIVTGILLAVMLRVAASYAQARASGEHVPKSRLAQLFETIIVYLRDEVIRPQLGHSTEKFLPFLLTVFFFILFNNLMGLVPLLDLQHLVGSFFGDPHFAVIGGTATGRIGVTAALATVAFVLIQVNGIRSSGVGGWAKHFLGGGPWYLAPIMLPVEIMGTFVKPFALALRLFANMTAGHILLAVLLIFTAAAPRALGLLGTPISLVAFGGAVAIFFLELFVALLQAFIFMFLTTLFIAQLMHHDEEHGHEHDHAHDEHAGAVAAH